LRKQLFVMILLLVGIALVLLVIYQYWHYRTHYPPGPWPLPVVGNSFQLISIDRWEDKFLDWKNKYGKCYTFMSGIIPVVTVNDYDMIVDMFIRDGETYADRFDIESFSKVIRRGQYGIIGTSGDLWREQRRFALKTLRDFGLGKNAMEDRIIEEIQTMFELVNKDIDSGLDEHDFYKRTDLAVGSIINNVVCGYRFTTNGKEDEFYKLKNCINEMMKTFSDPLIAVAVFSSFFRKIPPFNTKLNKGIALFNEVFEFLDVQIEQHEKNTDYTTLSESRDFIDAFLMEKTRCDESGETHYFSKDQLRNICVDIWFAGQETTTHTITWLLAFVINNPEAQKKMHEELDRVIRNDRMITVADKSQLPYTNAVVMETQRCANIIAINSLRKTTRETTINGYVLPKGTVVIPQISVLMIDPDIFPEPKKFNPSRFIDENGQLKHYSELMPFSVGKRQCPGEALARMELYLFAANLFNQYKFFAGNVPPSLKKEHNGASMGTKPYQCRVEKRFN